MAPRNTGRLFVHSAICAALVALASAGPSRAGLLFSGSSGTLAASAQFDLTGNTLVVTLTNTSTTNVVDPAGVLTGVFFDTTHTLTPLSASLFNGSTVHYGTLTNVGDGWGYATGVSAQGENSAISASGAVNGLGHSNFSAANNSLDGIDYGLLNAGFQENTGQNQGVTKHGPLISNAVQFLFTAGAGFSLSELGQSVVFQYGTSLSEPSFASGPPVVVPNVGVVPAPPSAILLGIGASLMGLAAYSRRWLPQWAA